MNNSYNSYNSYNSKAHGFFNKSLIENIKEQMKGSDYVDSDKDINEQIKEEKEKMKNYTPNGNGGVNFNPIDDSKMMLLSMLPSDTDPMLIAMLLNNMDSDLAHNYLLAIMMSDQNSSIDPMIMSMILGGDINPMVAMTGHNGNAMNQFMQMKMMRNMAKPKQSSYKPSAPQTPVKREPQELAKKTITSGNVNHSNFSKAVSQIEESRNLLKEKDKELRGLIVKLSEDVEKVLISITQDVDAQLVLRSVFDNSNDETTVKNILKITKEVSLAAFKSQFGLSQDNLYVPKFSGMPSVGEGNAFDVLPELKFYAEIIDVLSSLVKDICEQRHLKEKKELEEKQAKEAKAKEEIEKLNKLLSESIMKHIEDSDILKKLKDQIQSV